MNYFHDVIFTKYLKYCKFAHIIVLMHTLPIYLYIFMNNVKLIKFWLMCCKGL